MTDSRLSTAAVEALTDGTPDRRATAVAVEALSGHTRPESRAADLAVEALSGHIRPDTLLSLLAFEVLTPTALLAGITVDLDVAEETDLAFDLAGIHAASLGLASEADSVLDLVKASAVRLDVAEETDTSLTVRPTRPRDLYLASESDSALDMRAYHSIGLDPGEETDVARTFLSTPYPVRLINTDVGNFIDVPPRRDVRAPGRYLGVWPATQYGLALWRDGRVVEVKDWRNINADDYIAGGRVWVGMDNSWQAEVLEAAGYTLVRLDEED